MKRNEQLLDAIGGVGLDLVEQTEQAGPFGGAWRRFASVAACLALAAGITAAGIHFLPEFISAPEPYSGDITLPTEPAAPVTALYNKTVQYDDGLYQWGCEYTVPQLNFDSEDARAINAEIDDNFGEAVRQQLEAVEDREGIRFTDVSYYEYHNAPNIITLVCSKSYAQEYMDYAVYHYDADTHTRLTNTELLTALGIDPAEYLASLKQAAASRYLRNVMQWSDFSPGQCPSDDFRWEQYRNTVSEENLDIDTVPMYVSEGEIVAYPNIYMLAGADYYAELVTVMGGDLSWSGSEIKSKSEYRTTLSAAWTDSMDATLYWTDPEHPEKSGVYATIALPRPWYYERFCVLMDGYTWTQYDGICPAPGNFWLNLSGGGVNWTFWDDGEAGFLIVYDETGQLSCWKADFRYDADRESGVSIAEALRSEYDGAAVSMQGYPLNIDGLDSDAAAQATAEIWGRHLCNQAPGSVYGATDYRVVSVNVRTVADPPVGGTGRAMLFDMTLAVKPMLDGYASWLWAGNSYEGEGEWEGWMLFSREVVLQQLDGVWYIHDYGTGGLMLPTGYEEPEAEPEYQQKAP